MQPTVACIMLVNGREAMVRRAIKSFREQTYKPRSLFLYDTGPAGEFFADDQTDTPETPRSPRGYLLWIPSTGGGTIGALRNAANAASEDGKIIIHWDSDDWSHPNRIAEQVALLQSSGKQCVGYRDMLFWDERPGQFCGAWFYQNGDRRYCLGTSLCYWREIWEKRPFPDLPKRRGDVGEDTKWLEGVDSLGDVSLNLTRGVNYPDEPRMIASIHGSNSQYYNPGEYLARQQGNSWRRAPEWDECCRERMRM